MGKIKKVMVDGKPGTLIRESNPPVYLLDDGRFAAKAGPRWVFCSTIYNLDKELRIRPRFLRTVAIQTDDTVDPKDLWPGETPALAAQPNWPAWHIRDVTYAYSHWDESLGYVTLQRKRYRSTRNCPSLQLVVATPAVLDELYLIETAYLQAIEAMRAGLQKLLQDGTRVNGDNFPGLLSRHGQTE